MIARKIPSLVEVLVAGVVLGVITVVTVPRLTSAAATRDGNDHHDLLRQQLQVLRVAIERYYQDHGVYPGQLTDGQNPAGSAGALLRQLTGHSDSTGHVVTIATHPDTATHDQCNPPILGPYLRDGWPACPVPPNEGSTAIVVIRGAAPPAFIADVKAGWVYNCDTGQIAVNSDAADPAGRPYITY